MTHLRRHPPGARLLAATLLALVGLHAAAAEPGSSAQALHDAGIAANRNRDYAAAAAAFERAAAAEPTGAAHWFELGRARAKLEQWDGAIDAYRRAIAVDATLYKAHYNLGNVLFRRGDYAASAEAYAAALAIEPDYLLGLFQYGYTLRHLGRQEEAERAFEHCLELPAEPREQRVQVDCRYYLGALRFRARDFARALTLLEQVVAANPGNVEARYYLGMTYQRLGRRQEAEQQLEVHRRMLEQHRGSSPMEQARDELP